MANNILVPDIGDFEKVEIIEVLVKKGDRVKNDSIVTIESDKSSVEVPSNRRSVVENVKVKLGDKVSKGDILISVSSTTENIQKENINVDKNNISLENKSVVKKEEKNEKTVETLQPKKIKEKKEPIIVNDNKEDIDPIETKEWLESLSAVLANDGKNRAQFLIKQLIEHSYKKGSDLILSRNTPYINTIKPEEEQKSPGDQNLERKIRSLIRWNAAAMVVRATKNPELGGHIGILHQQLHFTMLV